MIQTYKTARYGDVFYSSFLVGLLKRHPHDVLFVRILDVPFRTSFERFSQVLFELSTFVDVHITSLTARDSDVQHSTLC